MLNFYNYSKVIYDNAKEDVIIICPLHGEFKQKPNYHLSGNGCTICYKENNGFGKNNFIYNCVNNKATLYIIHCKSEKEEFLKIGITSQTIKKRFSKKSRNPFTYTVLNQIEDTPENIYNLEKALHKTFRDLKYHPILKFRGSTECFLVNKKIIEYEF